MFQKNGKNSSHIYIKREYFSLYGCLFQNAKNVLLIIDQIKLKFWKKVDSSKFDYKKT